MSYRHREGLVWSIAEGLRPLVFNPATVALGAAMIFFLFLDLTRPVFENLPVFKQMTVQGKENLRVFFEVLATCVIVLCIVWAAEDTAENRVMGRILAAEARERKLGRSGAFSYTFSETGAEGREEFGAVALTPEQAAEYLRSVIDQVPEGDRVKIRPEHLRLITRRGLNAVIVAEKLREFRELLQQPRRCISGKGLNDVLAALVPYIALSSSNQPRLVFEFSLCHFPSLRYNALTSNPYFYAPSSQSPASGIRSCREKNPPDAAGSQKGGQETS